MAALLKTQYISIVHSNNIANIIGMTWTLQCVVTPVSLFGMLKTHFSLAGVCRSSSSVVI